MEKVIGTERERALRTHSPRGGPKAENQGPGTWTPLPSFPLRAFACMGRLPGRPSLCCPPGRGLLSSPGPGNLKTASPATTRTFMSEARGEQGCKLLECSRYAQPRFAKNPRFYTRKLLRNHKAWLQPGQATGRAGMQVPGHVQTSQQSWEGGT